MNPLIILGFKILPDGLLRCVAGITLPWHLQQGLNINDSDTWSVSARLSLDGAFSCSAARYVNERSERWDCCTKYADRVSRTSQCLLYETSREQTSQIHNALSLYQLLKKDGGEYIVQITAIHLDLGSRWCRASASAGGRIHVDPRDPSQAPSQGNYLEHAGHLTRLAMIYVALCTENIIRDTHIGL